MNKESARRRSYPPGATSVIGKGIISPKKGFGKLGLLFLLIDMSEGVRELLILMDMLEDVVGGVL